MSVTLTFGWWLAPAALTAAVWVWGLWPTGYVSTGGYFGDLDLKAVVRSVGALIATLFVWLAYFAGLVAFA